LKRFLDSLKALGTPRLLGLAGAGLAVLAIIGAIALHGSSQPMALLYGDLELADSAQVVATLDKLHVTYELKSGGSQILVPSDEVDRLRLTLAHDGLPAGGSVGYEIFDRGDSLTSNQFQQQINQLRALEGELGRTIRSIHGVRNARVHLVLAKHEPFAREQQEAQASIVLAMAGAQRMSNDEVLAILNLVATAVPGLKAQNISVVDNRGELLARAGRVVGPDGTSGSNDEIRRALEQQLGHAVEDMLGRTLGPGHVRAEASVEMNYERVNETQERFDPDGQVPRSQQSVTDSSKNTEAQASVSVQNNLPNPEAQSGGANGSATSRQEENTTFEIGKTVRTLVRDSPSIKKLTMAVLVDGTMTRTADGQSGWRELSQPDLDRIATLVKSAVGYDEKRGDRVDVVNMRFFAPDEIGDAEPAGYSWLHLQKADMVWLITIGAVVVVALFGLGFVVRPLALRLATGLTAPAPALAGPSGDGSPALLIGSDAQGAKLLLPGGQSADALDNDTMLNLANVEGQVRAASIQKLGDLVEAHPEATVRVIRGWLGQAAS